MLTPDLHRRYRSEYDAGPAYQSVADGYRIEQQLTTVTPQSIIGVKLPDYDPSSLDEICM